jgi:hypothetical protein
MDWIVFYAGLFIVFIIITCLIFVAAVNGNFEIFRDIDERARREMMDDIKEHPILLLLLLPITLVVYVIYLSMLYLIRAIYIGSLVTILIGVCIYFFMIDGYLTAIGNAFFLIGTISVVVFIIGSLRKN